MQEFTAEQLTSMLTSRKTPPVPVKIYRETIVMDAKPDEEFTQWEVIDTPFFVRVVTIPERVKIQAALDTARSQGKSETSCLSLVVRMTVCDKNGTRLFNDQWTGTGEADETMLAIFDAGMVANGYRKPKIVVHRKADGKLEEEKIETPSPEDVIGPN